MTKKYLIFVYGSLLKCLENAGTIVRSNGEFISEATLENAAMYSYGPFPVVALGEEGTVKGELYGVDTLEYLDALEGYPEFYNRSLVKITLPDKTKLNGFVYHIPESKKEYALELPKIESGDWREAKFAEYAIRNPVFPL